MTSGLTPVYLPFAPVDDHLTGSGIAVALYAFYAKDHNFGVGNGAAHP
jgi:hypothetical protein